MTMTMIECDSDKEVARTLLLCQALKRDPSFASSKLLFAIEANGNQVRVNSMARRLLASLPDAIVLHGVKSNLNTIGVWTYNKEQHRQRTSDVLRDNKLAFYRDCYFFHPQQRHELVEQMKNYRLEFKESKHPEFGELDPVLSGKKSGPDDGAMALQIAIIELDFVIFDHKYSKQIFRDRLR